MLSRAHRVLLFHSHFEPAARLPPQWIFPGGGIELGETRMDCALRELREETGRTFGFAELSDLSRSIVARKEWSDGSYQTDHSHFYLLRTDEFTPDDSLWTSDEHRDTIEHRWWSASEIQDQRPSIGPEGASELLLEILDLQRRVG